MKNHEQPRSEDELREENAQIKHRLKKDYGMKEYACSLPPQLENQWLKSIEAYEKNAREERREELRKGLVMN